MGSGFAYSLSAAVAMMFMTACEPVTTSGSAPDNSGKADWHAVYQRQKPRLADGWGTPVELPISRKAWTESVDVSADGQELRFFYWPGPDLFGAVMRGDEISEDGDIWISAAPFSEMRPISGYPHLTEDLYTSSGIMISGDGVSFAASNRRGQVTGDYDRENIYRNGEMLAFNTAKANPGNPHYCKARDELWLDGNADDWIGVIPNAARSMARQSG